MILEEETFEAYGHYPKDLTQRSGKPIIATCEFCGEFRATTKHDYRTFCKSHAGKGNKKRLGIKHTEETKARMSTALKGKKNPRWKGGKKLRYAKANAKRKHLGFILLMPLKDGEVGHHVTNEHVIGIPKNIHLNCYTGHNRKKHRTKVLQWLKANDKKKYIKVLCILAKEPLGNSA